MSLSTISTEVESRWRRMGSIVTTQIEYGLNQQYNRTGALVTAIRNCSNAPRSFQQSVDFIARLVHFLSLNRLCRFVLLFLSHLCSSRCLHFQFASLEIIDRFLLIILHTLLLVPFLSSKKMYLQLWTQTMYTIGMCSCRHFCCWSDSSVFYIFLFVECMGAWYYKELEYAHF